MDITTIAGLTVALIVFAVLGAFVLSRRRGSEEALAADEPTTAPSARRRSPRSDASLDEPVFDQARAEEPGVAHVSLDEAANDVRDRVSRVSRRLPDDADQVSVQKADADSQPIMWLTLAGEGEPLADPDDILPLAEAPEAHRRLDSGATRGKLLLAC